MSVNYSFEQVYNESQKYGDVVLALNNFKKKIRQLQRNMLVVDESSQTINGSFTKASQAVLLQSILKSYETLVMTFYRPNKYLGSGVYAENEKSEDYVALETFFETIQALNDVYAAGGKDFTDAYKAICTPDTTPKKSYIFFAITDLIDVTFDWLTAVSNYVSTRGTSTTKDYLVKIANCLRPLHDGYDPDNSTTSEGVDYLINNILTYSSESIGAEIGIPPYISLVSTELDNLFNTYITDSAYSSYKSSLKDIIIALLTEAPKFNKHNDLDPTIKTAKEVIDAQLVALSELYYSVYSNENFIYNNDSSDSSLDDDVAAFRVIFENFTGTTGNFKKPVKSVFKNLYNTVKFFREDYKEKLEDSYEAVCNIEVTPDFEDPDGSGTTVSVMGDINGLITLKPAREEAVNFVKSLLNGIEGANPGYVTQLYWYVVTSLKTDGSDPYVLEPSFYDDIFSRVYNDVERKPFKGSDGEGSDDPSIEDTQIHLERCYDAEFNGISFTVNVINTNWIDEFVKYLGDLVDDEVDTLGFDRAVFIASGLVEELRRLLLKAGGSSTDNPDIEQLLDWGYIEGNYSENGVYTDAISLLNRLKRFHGQGMWNGLKNLIYTPPATVYPSIAPFYADGAALPYGYLGYNYQMVDSSKQVYIKFNPGKPTWKIDSLQLSFIPAGDNYDTYTNDNENKGVMPGIDPIDIDIASGSTLDKNVLVLDKESFKAALGTIYKPTSQFDLANYDDIGSHIDETSSNLARCVLTATFSTKIGSATNSCTYGMKFYLLGKTPDTKSPEVKFELDTDTDLKDVSADLKYFVTEQGNIYYVLFEVSEGKNEELLTSTSSLEDPVYKTDVFSITDIQEMAVASTTPSFIVNGIEYFPVEGNHRMKSMANTEVSKWLKLPLSGLKPSTNYVMYSVSADSYLNFDETVEVTSFKTLQDKFAAEFDITFHRELDTSIEIKVKPKSEKAKFYAIAIPNDPTITVPVGQEAFKWKYNPQSYRYVVGGIPWLQVTSTSADVAKASDELPADLGGGNTGLTLSQAAEKIIQGKTANDVVLLSVTHTDDFVGAGIEHQLKIPKLSHETEYDIYIVSMDASDNPYILVMDLETKADATAPEVEQNILETDYKKVLNYTVTFTSEPGFSRYILVDAKTDNFLRNTYNTKETQLGIIKQLVSQLETENITEFNATQVGKVLPTDDFAQKDILIQKPVKYYLEYQSSTNDFAIKKLEPATKYYLYAYAGDVEYYNKGELGDPVNTKVEFGSKFATTKDYTVATIKNQVVARDPETNVLNLSFDLQFSTESYGGIIVVYGKNDTSELNRSDKCLSVSRYNDPNTTEIEKGKQINAFRALADNIDKNDGLYAFEYSSDLGNFAKVEYDPTQANANNLFVNSQFVVGNFLPTFEDPVAIAISDTKHVIIPIPYYSVPGTTQYLIWVVPFDRYRDDDTDTDYLYSSAPFKEKSNIAPIDVLFREIHTENGVEKPRLIAEAATSYSE